MTYHGQESWKSSLLDQGRSPHCATRADPLLNRSAAVAVISALVLAATLVPPPPLLVWNASASAPRGLYAVTPGALPRPGDIAVARLRDAARRIAAQRHYLPVTAVLVKRVAAGAGDRVCAQGQSIRINGRAAARRHSRDSTGRPLPTWTGCVRLREGDLFLLSDHPASFDGRYFGITQEHDVIGRAELIWAR
jgi:conjugative transfer signal peptidase TraF